MNEQNVKAFDFVWSEVIRPAIENAFSSMDGEFKEAANAKVRDLEKLRETFEKDFKTNRYSFKIRVYKAGNKDLLLDSRKLGSIICVLLIKDKAIEFDEDKALEFVSNRRKHLDSQEYNVWACSNFLINYKIAYQASLSLVYLSCLYCLENNVKLLKERDYDSETRGRFVQLLKDQRKLCNYPKWNDFDSFGINMIIALARTDFSDNDLDVEMYALQLWQYEMYTYKTLESMMV